MMAQSTKSCDGRSLGFRVQGSDGVGNTVREVRIKIREAQKAVEAEKRHLTLPGVVPGREWLREGCW